MHRKDKAKWEWNEGKVDRAAPYLKLFYGDWGPSALPVALVAEAEGKVFPVEFLQVSNLEQSEYKRIKEEVAKELTFYLVELGEENPWNYAIYHCGTAANVYGKVHWAYYPGGEQPTLF